MSWAKMFLSVPTDYLTLDPSTSAYPGKSSPDTMRGWMSLVPEIYALRSAGLTDAQFAQMASAPVNERERALGETYRNLFSTSASAHPLRASLLDGKGLIVDAGQHRVLAAKQAGVPFLPVHVSASTLHELDRLRDGFELEVRQLAPHLHAVAEIQRAHDAQHYPTRRVERSSHVERPTGAERLGPEPEPRWRFPERER